MKNDSVFIHFHQIGRGVYTIRVIQRNSVAKSLFEPDRDEVEVTHIVFNNKRF